MPKEKDIVQVKMPRELRDEYDALPKSIRRRWMSFPGFVRDAVRAYLDEYELRAVRRIVEREQPDHPPPSSEPPPS